MSYLEGDNFIKIQTYTLNKVFEELNKNLLQYCVLRNFEKLPEYIGNDIDLLISKKEINPISDIIIRIMNENDFIVSKKIERFGHLGLYFSHTRYKETIIFDLLSRNLKIWYEYADSEYILSNLIPYKNFYIPPQGSILYTVLFKDLLTYGYVRSKNNSLLENINENDKESFILTGKNFFSLNLLQEVFEGLKKNKIKTSKKKLFFELQFKIKLKNVYRYMYFRVKEIIGK